MSETPQAQRLQKFLSAAGIASRREAEELIAQGRISVNGRTARLGQRVGPGDEVRVDGRPVMTQGDYRYIALNKPEGYITSAKDPQGRPKAVDLLGEEERLFSAGRLDAATEGLLIFTNDGELAHRMTHPSFGLPKTYLAQVQGKATGRSLATLTSEGVRIDRGRPARADEVKVVSKAPDRTLIEITVHEGRKHVVRKMFAEVGLPVQRLVRTAIGPVRLGRLAPGTYRKLTADEVAALYQAVGL